MNTIGVAAIEASGACGRRVCTCAAEADAGDSRSSGTGCPFINECIVINAREAGGECVAHVWNKGAGLAIHFVGVVGNDPDQIGASHREDVAVAADASAGRGAVVCGAPNGRVA